MLAGTGGSVLDGRMRIILPIVVVSVVDDAVEFPAFATLQIGHAGNSGGNLVHSEADGFTVITQLACRNGNLPLVRRVAPVVVIGFYLSAIHTRNCRTTLQLNERLIAQIGGDGKLSIIIRARTGHSAWFGVIRFEVQVYPIAIPHHSDFVHSVPSFFIAPRVNAVVNIVFRYGIPIGKITIDYNAVVGSRGSTAFARGAAFARGRFARVAGTGTRLGARTARFRPARRSIAARSIGRPGFTARATTGRRRRLNGARASTHLSARNGAAAERYCEIIIREVGSRHGNGYHAARRFNGGPIDILIPATFNLAAIPCGLERIVIALGAIAVNNGERLASGIVHAAVCLDGKHVVVALLHAVPAEHAGITRSKCISLAHAARKHPHAQQKSQND